MSESEAFYRTLLDEALDIIVVVGRDGTVSYASPSLERLLGYHPDELTGRHAIGFIHPDDLATVLETFAAGSQEPGGVRRLTFRFSHKDGRWRTLEATGRNLFDDPAIAGAVINARDVTERHEAERRFRMIFDAEPECVKLVGRDGGLIAINAAGLAMLEAEHAGAVLGRPLERFVTFEHRPAFHTFAARVLGGTEAEIEFEIHGLKGTRRVLHSHAVPLRDGDGEVAQVLAITRDVTAARRAERVQVATYRISEATHRAPDVPQLLAEIHLIVAELMPARNFYVALRDEAAGLLSFPYFSDERDTSFAPRPLRRGLTEYVLRTGVPLLLDHAVEQDLVARGEVEPIGTDSLQWLGVPLRVDDRVIGVIAVQTYDPAVRYTEAEREILEYVSVQVASAIERKRATQALAAGHALLEAVIEGTGDGIFAKDLDGRYLLINSASLRFLGRPREDLQGRREADLFPAEKVQIWQDADRRIVATGTAETSEWTEPSPSGERQLVVTKSPLRDRFGTVIGVLGVVGDVTERRRLERQLRQAQKMEAIGQLAGGVAHDFNNLLTAITGYTDLLLAACPADDPRHADLLEIRQSALRAAALTQQLLAFGRKQLLQPKVLDLNAVVANTQALLRRLIGEHIRIESRLQPRLGRVQADPGQIEQVIVNLAVNARDAMPEGGRLLLETDDAEIDASQVPDHPPMVPGRYVRLSVSDTGTGMNEHTRAHLFEPFFTTKEVGKGTGLGLATVYGIVKQSGGYVWAYSELGSGSTFKIYLPRVDAPAEPARAPDVPQTMPRGSETILLTEDEPTVRAAVRNILERQGYTVLEAERPTAALTIACEHPGTIHLLLTDVVMPEMRGPALADQVTALRPGIRVLFVSGYTDEAIVHEGMLDPGTQFLQKPFTAGALARKLREVLDGL